MTMPRLNVLTFVAPFAATLAIASGTAAAPHDAAPGPIKLRCEQRPYVVTFEDQRALVHEPTGEDRVLPRLPGRPGINGPITYTDGHLTFTRDRIDPERSPIGFQRDKVVSGVCEVMPS
jgi:hypothetical protein